MRDETENGKKNVPLDLERARHRTTRKKILMRVYIFPAALWSSKRKRSVPSKNPINTCIFAFFKQFQHIYARICRLMHSLSVFCRNISNRRAGPTYQFLRKINIALLNKEEIWQTGNSSPSTFTWCLIFNSCWLRAKYSCVSPLSIKKTWYPS